MMVLPCDAIAGPCIAVQDLYSGKDNHVYYINIPVSEWAQDFNNWAKQLHANKSPAVFGEWDISITKSQKKYGEI